MADFEPIEPVGPALQGLIGELKAIIAQLGHLERGSTLAKLEEAASRSGALVGIAQSFRTEARREVAVRRLARRVSGGRRAA